MNLRHKNIPQNRIDAALRAYDKFVEEEQLEGVTMTVVMEESAVLLVGEDDQGRRFAIGAIGDDTPTEHLFKWADIAA